MSGKMLDTGAYSRILKALHRACHHLGYQSRIAAESPISYHFVIRIGQHIRDRCKIQVKAIFLQITADCLAGRIGCAGISPGPNVGHRPHIVSFS